MTWTEFKTFFTSRFTPKYANTCAGVVWLDLRQTHSIKPYVEKFQGIVSPSDYNRLLKFIHELQLWVRKLIVRMPQLPDNLQDLMRMAERLGDDAVDKREPGGEARPAKVDKDNNRGRSVRSTKKTNMCTRSLSLSPTIRQKG